MQPKKVLVVDDEECIREVLCKSLTLKGYTVAAASDGHEALQVVREFLPDAIILDVMMPKENGYRVSRTIKLLGDSGSLPMVPKILILTGRDLSYDEEREKMMNTFSMADRVMYKPFKMAHLLDEITNLTS